VFRRLRDNPTTRTAREIYGSIVTSARQRTFYADWKVPDTPEGRFELLVIHMALVMQRLGRAGASGPDLSRALAEAFVIDIDDNMREIGIGDLAVPRKVKRAAAALYDRHTDIGAALASGDSAAVAAIVDAAAATLGDAAVGLDRASLVRYIERLGGALAVTGDEDCLAGRLPLPWPAI
jgi:cytochrome b pre-mRNA-processing protein 3